MSNVHRVVAEGDLVAVHANYKTFDMAGVDVFRLNEDKKIIEHWDAFRADTGDHREWQ
jgi:predicted SnoaL-like aldol condensation-catalyzing enzyme